MNVEQLITHYGYITVLIGAFLEGETIVIIAGFAAQSENIEQSVISGVYVHSLAADLLVDKFTEYGYTAKDISNKLPDAIRFLRNTFA